MPGFFSDRNLSIKKIAYYISAHGYGHAARSAAVLHALGNRYSIQIKSEIPKHFFTRHGLHHEVAPQGVDTGCVQSNFAEVDIPASWAALRAFMENRKESLLREKEWLDTQDMDLVVSDAPFLPLAAARLRKRPSLLIANFTWHDIYSNFPGAADNTDLLEQLQQDYSTATLQLLPQCHLENQIIDRRKEIGMIGLRGNNIRQQVIETLPPALQSRRLVFVYAGQYDASVIHWEALSKIKDCVFLTRDPLPHDPEVDNLILLDETFNYPDLMASCDLIVTKGGYSTLATAFVHGLPVLSCERPDFKEFEAVAAFLEERQVGQVLGKEAFYRGEWANAVKKCLKMTVTNKVPLNGEQEVCLEIDRLLASEPI